MTNCYKKIQKGCVGRLKWKDEKFDIGLCACVMQLKEGISRDSKVVESVPDTGVNQVLELIESHEGVVKGGPSAIVGVDCTDSDAVVCSEKVNYGVDRTDKSIDQNNLTQHIINYC